ncbi:endonuclease NucS domain-containing protein [Clostridium sporogenes]|uniref:endonuclease NucS domain-containing protein n=2 Tax=Clostridium sporogenes TaxID=1509 RepID=UPI0005EDF617|nr:endonuclease NucS domain-containing protein [Clostridium sporogenes]
MAGYIMGLNNKKSLEDCINSGIYSTNLSDPRNGKWKIHHEGTFADYFGMREGDNIYFFIDRKIYGIGELINIKNDCKYWNYINAETPENFTYNEIKDTMILDNEDNLNNRCLCIFKPYPNFFTRGIDMDDVLASNPSKFRMLRAFWKLSFIKIDDEENNALKDIILKRNEEFIFKNDNNSFKYNSDLQREKLKVVNKGYIMDSKALLESCSNNKAIKHEMAIEAALVDMLSNNKDTIFGEWDYISHQVIASPFKPIDYMDKMDLFGFKYISGFNTISKYLVVEIKKNVAKIDAVEQVMKYVDWINQEYAFGDYGMIQAFIVAYDFSEDTVRYKNSVCIRNYTTGRRPTTPSVWKSVRLIKYRFENNNLNFYEVK